MVLWSLSMHFGIRLQVYESSYFRHIEMSRKHTLADIRTPVPERWYRGYLNLITMNSLSSVRMCDIDNFIRESKRGMMYARTSDPVSTLRLTNKFSVLLFNWLKSAPQNDMGVLSIALSASVVNLLVKSQLKSSGAVSLYINCNMRS